MDIQVEPAVERDLVYIDHLQRKNAEDLAFYPKQVFEREVLNHRILLARVNGEHAGYIYHGSLGHQVKIHQACIEYDLRGQLYGAALIRHLIDLASASNAWTTCEGLIKEISDIDFMHIISGDGSLGLFIKQPWDANTKHVMHFYSISSSLF